MIRFACVVSSRCEDTLSEQHRLPRIHFRRFVPPSQSKLAVDVFGNEYLAYKGQNTDKWLRLKEKLAAIPSALDKYQHAGLDYYSSFKLFVQGRQFGNVSRIWRKYIDANGMGKASFNSFSNALSKLGYMGNSRLLFWAIGRGRKFVLIDDFEPQLVDDFVSFVRAARQGAGSVMKLLQKFGFRNIEQPVSRGVWKKMLDSLAFFTLEEKDAGESKALSDQVLSSRINSPKHHYPRRSSRKRFGSLQR